MSKIVPKEKKYKFFPKFDNGLKIYVISVL